MDTGRVRVCFGGRQRERERKRERGGQGSRQEGQTEIK